MSKIERAAFLNTFQPVRTNQLGELPPAQREALRLMDFDRNGQVGNTRLEREAAWNVVDSFDRDGNRGVIRDTSSSFEAARRLAPGADTDETGLHCEGPYLEFDRRTGALEAGLLRCTTPATGNTAGEAVRLRVTPGLGLGVQVTAAEVRHRGRVGDTRFECTGTVGNAQAENQVVRANGGVEVRSGASADIAGAECTFDRGNGQRLEVGLSEGIGAGTRLGVSDLDGDGRLEVRARGSLGPVTLGRHEE